MKNMWFVSILNLFDFNAKKKKKSEERDEEEGMKGKKTRNWL